MDSAGPYQCQNNKANVESQCDEAEEDRCAADTALALLRLIVLGQGHIHQ